MGIKNIFDIFKSKEQKLRQNPAIIINFASELQGNGHALLVANTDDYTIKDELVSPRRDYKAYPRDVDETMDEDEIQDILKTEKHIISPKGFIDIFGKGAWSRHRTMIVIFPNDPDDLPESLKGTWVSRVVIEKKYKREFIQQLLRGDIEATQLYEQNKSLYLETIRKDYEKALQRIIGETQKPQSVPSNLNKK